MKAKLKGVKNLSAKECDRIQVLTDELKKMGCRVSHTETEIRLSSTRLNPTKPVDVHNDHRIAMSFGVLTLIFPDLQILNPSSVTKSFPAFWKQMELIKGLKAIDDNPHNA